MSANHFTTQFAGRALLVTGVCLWLGAPRARAAETGLREALTFHASFDGGEVEVRLRFSPHVVVEETAQGLLHQASHRLVPLASNALHLEEQLIADLHRRLHTVHHII